MEKHQLTLPDGADFDLIINPVLPDIEELRSLVHDRQLRVIYQDSANQQIPEDVDIWDTSFFVEPREKLEERGFYLENRELRRILDLEIEKLRALMKGSFSHRLTKSIEELSPDIYLLNNEETGETIGTFSLQDVGNGEVQLHSVAGIADYPGISKMQRKAPHLFMALLKTFGDEYPDSDKLTFTCSRPKVIEMYKNFGFETDPKRKGIILT